MSKSGYFERGVVRALSRHGNPPAWVVGFDAGEGGDAGDVGAAAYQTENRKTATVAPGAEDDACFEAADGLAVGGDEARAILVAEDDVGGVGRIGVFAKVG